MRNHAFCFVIVFHLLSFDAWGGTCFVMSFSWLTIYITKTRLFKYIENFTSKKLMIFR